jgi:PmbA protein
MGLEDIALLQEKVYAWLEEGKRLGADQVEIYLQDQRGVSVKAYRGAIEELRSSASRGVGIRVFDGGKLGYAYVSGMEDREVMRAIQEARDNARYSTPDDCNQLPAFTKYVREDLGLYHPEAMETPVERKVEMALELEELALQQDSRIVNVDTTLYADSVYRIALANSSGFCGSYEGSDCHCYVAPIAREGEESQLGFSFAVGKRPSELDLSATAREAAEKALALLGGRSIPSRRTVIVLDNLIAAEFLGVIAPALSAEAVLKGRSLFAGKVGERVASEGLYLVDDGLLYSGMATTPFDDEGVTSQKTAVISDGVLQSYLHTTYTALRCGGKSTGNARRGSFRNRPRVAPTNFYLEPGKKSRQEIIREVDEGVLILNLVGVHAGANPISGEISLGAQGQLIRKGRIGQPLREITIAGQMLDLLQNVVLVGNDLRFIPVGGSLGSPTLAIEGVMLAGR